MEKFNYNGYEIEVYSGYNGDEIFINKDGKKFYSARVNKGTGRERAIEKVS